MARVIIILEDQPNGRVAIKSEPEAETVVKMIKSGHKTTPAEDYALLVRTLLKRISERMDAKKASSIVMP